MFRNRTDIQEISELLKPLVKNKYCLEFHVTSEFKWNKIIVPN